MGDLLLPDLGIDPAAVKALTGTVDHLVHLAALYDMTTDDATNEAANVDGTRPRGRAGQPARRRVPPPRVVGGRGRRVRGPFTEDMFDEGQPLPSPYHRTKFEAERIVRDEATVPWRVYRPAIVVGHSRTGEIDKIDGPYYLFETIRRLAHLPSAAADRGARPRRHQRRARSTTSPTPWTT